MRWDRFMSEIREEVAPIRSAGPVERVAFVPEGALNVRQE